MERQKKEAHTTNKTKQENKHINYTSVTGKEVTKQLVFDGLCSVNAQFILKV
jgi:hypothetical protein